MSNKTAFITGGSRGIGKATVNEFLDCGYQVITTNTNGTQQISNNSLVTYKYILGNTEDENKIVNELEKNHILLDVLINNAGIKSHDETQIDIEVLKKTLETNLIGTISLTLKLLKFINTNAVIINITSGFASLTEDWGSRDPSYRISKAALNMFTRNFYKDPRIEAKNIKVYSFEPGWVKTDMGGPKAPRDPNEPAKELVDLVKSNKEPGMFYRGINGNIVTREW